MPFSKEKKDIVFSQKSYYYYSTVIPKAGLAFGSCGGFYFPQELPTITAICAYLTSHERTIFVLQVGSIRFNGALRSILFIKINNYRRNLLILQKGITKRNYTKHTFRGIIAEVPIKSRFI